MKRELTLVALLFVLLVPYLRRSGQLISAHKGAKSRSVVKLTADLPVTADGAVALSRHGSVPAIQKVVGDVEAGDAGGRDQEDEADGLSSVHILTSSKLRSGTFPAHVPAAA